MIRSIDHVIIAVADLEAAALDYSSLLGCQPSWSGEHVDWGTGNVLFGLDGIYVELLAPIGEGGLADALRYQLETRGEGIFAIAFATDDAAVCAATLRERGLAASEPVPGEGVNAEGKVRRWRNVLLPTEASRGVMVFAIEHLSDSALLPAARALGAAPICGIDHIVIRSGAADATRDFYRDGLGIRLALDREFPQWGARMLFFKIDGVVLEIVATLDEPGDDAPPPDEAWGISWRVSDVAATQARLCAAGFDVSEVREGRKPDTQVCSVRDRTHGVATLLLGKE
ncbi:MAG: VOC family protein [Deltaproteobacteria bacterium]